MNAATTRRPRNAPRRQIVRWVERGLPYGWIAPSQRAALRRVRELRKGVDPYADFSPTVQP
jgi:hypothetical protein